jgi:hypothetical protein
MLVWRRDFIYLFIHSFIYILTYELKSVAETWRWPLTPSSVEVMNEELYLLSPQAPSWRLAGLFYLTFTLLTEKSTPLQWLLKGIYKLKNVNKWKMKLQYLNVHFNYIKFVIANHPYQVRLHIIIAPPGFGFLNYM